MPSIVTNIARIEPGGESLVSAKKANEIIDALNAIRNGYLFPNVNVGKISVSATQFIIDLSQFDQRLQDLESASSNSTSNITLLQNNVTIIQGNISNIENRIANPNITASGTCTGSNIAINISLTI